MIDFLLLLHIPQQKEKHNGYEILFAPNSRFKNPGTGEDLDFGGRSPSIRVDPQRNEIRTSATGLREYLAQRLVLRVWRYLLHKTILQQFERRQSAFQRTYLHAY